MTDWVETSPALVHTPIIRMAARKANEMVAASDEFPKITNPTNQAVFAEINRAPEEQQRFRLTLTRTGQALPPEKRPMLEQIAAEAVRSAILDPENKEMFVGVILGYARQGINYFDRYAKGQMRLF